MPPSRASRGRGSARGSGRVSREGRAGPPRKKRVRRARPNQAPEEPREERGPRDDIPLSRAFEELGLAPHLLRALARSGYQEPTPIQERAIPVVLRGRDLLAGAQTGTGKTAAFALPILQGLFPKGRKPNARAPKAPRALILTPTRELAAQVEQAFQTYGRNTPLRCTAIFGGVGIEPQIRRIAQGLDVLVATPGRLIDLFSSGDLDLRSVQILVLDEADRMLDMGFLPSIRRILDQLPPRRQNLLFSATLPKEIGELASRFLHRPISVQVAPHNTVATRVLHRMHPVRHREKRHLLEQLLRESPDRQTLVFCRTKHGSDRLTRVLNRAGLTALAIHGNKSQGARTKALDSFKRGDTKILVATDIAARGLDIRDLPMVVNFDLPMVAEDYVHRIGRTGRAGMEGQAVSLVSDRERDLLRDIEKLLGEAIERVPVQGFEPHEDPNEPPPPPRGARPPRPPKAERRAGSKPARSKPMGRRTRRALRADRSSSSSDQPARRSRRTERTRGK